MERFQLESIYLYFPFDETTVENKGKLILSWWLSTATMLNKVRFLMSALSLIKINMCCTVMPGNSHKKVIFAHFKSF